MAKLQPDLRSSAQADNSFYLFMSLILTAIVVFGFSHTVPHDFEAPGLPGILQLHATVFIAWVLLFIAQPALVMKRSIAVHRKLGWVGLGLACAMVALGGFAIMFALWNHTLPFFYPPGLFLVRGIVGLALFAGLITAAILRRKQADWHKRLMLCAAIVIASPGLERALPLPLFGAAWPFVSDGVLGLIALIGPVVDLARRKRVHPAYLYGVGAMVASQAVVDLIAPSPLAPILLRAVGAQ